MRKGLNSLGLRLGQEFAGMARSGLTYIAANSSRYNFPPVDPMEPGRLNNRLPSHRAISIMGSIAILLAMMAVIAPAYGIENGSVQDAEVSTTWSSPLVIVECIWLFAVIVGLPTFSHFAGKSRKASSEELRGLNMPRGSIRGILSLVTVGSFVNVMVFGSDLLGESFEATLAAFGALTGSIIGFYFGNRTAAPSPPK